MIWPDKVVRQFARIPDNPTQADFHGPYNKLLNTVFPVDTDFTVVPQRMPGSRESTESLVLFETCVGNKPAFILAIQPPSVIGHLSLRHTADQQIRTRIGDLHTHCPLPVLHAVSAAGTKLCFYKKPCGQPLVPPLISAHPDLLSDTAPRDRWDCDILEEEGAKRFMDIVNEIKQACASIS